MNPDLCDYVILIFITWKKQYIYRIIKTGLFETSSAETSDVTLLRLHDFEKTLISQLEFFLLNLKSKKTITHRFNETYFEGC